MTISRLSGDTANTLPKALVDCDAELPPKVINPLCPKFEVSTPRYALVPLLSKIIEFGEFGSVAGVPAAKVDPDELVIGTMVVLHAALLGLAVRHAVVVA